MSTTRDLLMLVAGVSIGGMGGWLVTSASASSVERPASVTVVERAQAPGATPLAATASHEERVAVAEEALSLERASRARAEEHAVALEEELARARSGSITRPAVLDKAAIAARIKAIEEEVAAAKDKKDGKKLVALYVELSRYGKDAWPLAAKVGAMFSGVEDGDATELGISTSDFYKAFVTADFAGLYVDALGHPDAYDKTFRQVAIWGLSMCDSSGAGPVLLEALKTEKDASMIQMIAGLLAQNPPPGAADAIVAALAEQKNEQAQYMLAWTLGRIPGDDATRAIQGLVAQTTDETIKAQLDQSLKVRSAPVAGYYVLAITPESDADKAGLRQGDVIVSLNGKPLKGWMQLQDNGDDANQGDAATVALSVYRDGATFDLRLGGAKSIWERGVQGDFSKGK
ncbi:MAG TPA: PDZ domain-containing protein [Planctomycetota bacterium]|nr:PDZ domain-containing protein [Planctomycetota bacterium]